MKKFKKVFLHIGLEKTGTTSIQRALDIHREKLAELGYFYPKATAVGKNVLLAAMFNPDLTSRPTIKVAVERKYTQTRLSIFCKNWNLCIIIICVGIGPVQVSDLKRGVYTISLFSMLFAKSKEKIC